MKAYLYPLPFTTQSTQGLSICCRLTILTLLFLNTFAFIAHGQINRKNNTEVQVGDPEKCNGIDDDRDGLIDENCHEQTDETFLLPRVTSEKPKLKARLRTSLDLDVVVTPNPSEGEFRLELKGSNIRDKIRLIIFDNNGRLVEVRNDLLIGHTIIIGSKFAQGMYFIKAIQGTRSKTLKVIKQ